MALLASALISLSMFHGELCVFCPEAVRAEDAIDIALRRTSLASKVRSSAFPPSVAKCPPAVDAGEPLLAGALLGASSFRWLAWPPEAQVP